jgi:hypothetical protein
MFFDQYDVLPAVLGQVVQNRHTYGAAPDYNDPRLSFHDLISFPIQMTND